jgi:hypothetical protein
MPEREGSPTPMGDEPDPRALLAAATKRPWQWWTSNSHCRLGTLDHDGNIAYGYNHPVDGVSSIVISEADAALIVWAVNNLERLLDTLDEGDQVFHDVLRERGEAVDLLKGRQELRDENQYRAAKRETALRSELRESRAAEARLREALLPIVNSLDLKDERDTDYADTWGTVRAGDLRRAREALGWTLSASDGGGIER